MLLIGPYNQGFVDALVASVPSSAREWRPATKAWRIGEEYEATVRQLIADFTKD